LSTSNSWPGLERVGHRITATVVSSSRGAGYEKVHGRRSTTPTAGLREVLADEQKGDTVLDSLARAVGWFSEQRDSPVGGSSADPRPPLPLLETAEKPVAPWISSPSAPSLHAQTNRRPKDVSQKPSLAEWAYVIAYQTSDERNAATPLIWGIYNGSGATNGSRWPSLLSQCLQRLADR